MNKELRTKLKKVDNIINDLGYYFSLNYGSLFVSPCRDDYDSPESWVRLYLRKIYLNNEETCKLYFYAEPCRLSGGTGFLPCDKAEVICVHWKRLLNACNIMNELNIEGNPTEIKECIMDIFARKRK